MKKTYLILPMAIALLGTGAVFAQTADVSATATVAPAPVTVKAPMALTDAQKATLKTAEDKIVALRKELEEKVKSLRADYEKQFVAIRADAKTTAGITGGEKREGAKYTTGMGIDERTGKKLEERKELIGERKELNQKQQAERKDLRVEQKVEKAGFMKSIRNLFAPKKPLPPVSASATTDTSASVQ